MGNCLASYRVAIGLFNNIKSKSQGAIDFRADTYQDIIMINLRCSALFASLLVFQSLTPKVNIIFLLFVLHFILLIGNVESNPGPETYSTGSQSSQNLSDKSVSICNINIRSIRNKIDFLEHFAEDVDILVVTETHLDNVIQNSEIYLDTFSENVQRKDRNNSGGGLLIYAKENIKIDRKSELENDVDETIWVEVHAKGHSFLLCSTYRPEWSGAEYWIRLNHAIGLAYQISDKIVLVGDLNSNLLASQNNKLKEIINLFNLINVIDKPTRTTDFSRTLLDPIILSDNINYLYSDVLDIPRSVSDHDAAFCIIECPKSLCSVFKREIWQYDKTDLDKFRQKMDQTDWEGKLGSLNDVDDMCQEFTKLFLEIARDCIPTKTVIVRNNDKPWFSHELRKEIRIRDRLRKKVLKFNRATDIGKYKKQRNKVNNMKKIAKEKFENNLDNVLLENAGSSKSYWKIMKLLIKSNKGSNSLPPLLNILDEDTRDEFIYEDNEKCELLNKYFCTITKLQEENVPLPNLEDRTDNVINHIDITNQEIIDIINSLNPKKASGPDKISHQMLKICPEKTSIPLKIIFNKSLIQRKYPSNWKIANVIAIFKKK